MGLELGLEKMLLLGDLRGDWGHWGGWFGEKVLLFFVRNEIGAVFAILRVRVRPAIYQFDFFGVFLADYGNDGVDDGVWKYKCEMRRQAEDGDLVG